MRDPILVVNAGSSSIKFSVFETLSDRSLVVGAHGQVEGIGSSPRLEVANAQGQKLKDEAVPAGSHDAAMAAINAWFADHVGSEAGFFGIGHRIVHGGQRYSQPVLIDDAVLRYLEEIVPLAPLHEPHNITAIRAAAALAPNVPQVACFDTAFHARQPSLAQEFALPRALTAKGVRRYGFHGLSYEYIVSAVPKVAPAVAGKKIIVAHLGSGASMCAIENGRSVATTMGLTPVDGLPMGTRTGSLDPGVILYLLQQERMSAETVEQMIYKSSGLLGVSGVSGDMRILLASAVPAAKEAVDLFVYWIGRELGSLSAALRGLDALVFTAGIGEHSAEIRERVCRNAHWLGVDFDEEANARCGPCISTAGSKVSAWVIPTEENLMVARHTRDVLDARSVPSSA
jgi:acetate kinase